MRGLVRRASSARGPRLKGLGVSFYLAESAPPSAETVRLELTKGGKLVLFVGVAPTGQGSELALANIVSSRLHTKRGSVEVRFGDTRTSRPGMGTQSSRSIAYAGSAAMLSCGTLVKRIEERLLSTCGDATSVKFRAGFFHQTYKDGRSRDLDFAQAAGELGPRWPWKRPTGRRPPPSRRVVTSRWWRWILTGSVQVVHHLTFDDFGTVLDRSALTSQVDGGIVQSIGEALQERVGYDPDGRLSGSYLLPSVMATPRFSHAPVQLTTSQHLHGARGAGEAGTIGSLPAIVNAVENALSSRRRNAVIRSIPVSAEEIREILSEY